jgi:ligand-binding sensor domain-containing protein/signal transduction histidine kinase/DNA-binding response OmpR family regulator
MHSKRITTLTTILFMLMPLTINGQKVRLYSSEQGLPNSMIHKVCQDERGYIWIATENGVSYFDGMRFTTFHYDRNQPGTISSDLVKFIYTDSRGTCWICTSNGLQTFDYENNVFRDFPLHYPGFSGTYYVSSILESPDKEKLLVSIAGAGIVVYDVKTYNIDLVSTYKLKNIYGTAFLGNMFFDSEGYLWTFAEQGNFYRLNFKHKTIAKELWAPELTKLSKEIVVSSIVEDPVNGNLLIGTFNHGLFIFDRLRGCVRRAKGASSPKYRIRTLLAETKKGHGSDFNIWIGTEGSGLKKFNRKEEDIIKTDFQYSPIDLDNCRVHSIVQDSQGNIWAGIFQKGLLIIPRSTYGFEYLKLSESQGAMSENQACATSISRDQTGELWVGTDGGGLFLVSKTGKITHYTKENTPLPNNSILTLASDKRGTLWISTYMGGITTYNQNAGFRSYSNRLELQKVNSSLYDSKNDKLYFGTLGHGVRVLSIAENRIESFTNYNNAGWVSALCLDRSGNLWVGSSNGINCYNTKTGIEKNIKGAEKVSKSRIYSFLEDHNGSIWIGSADGLFHYINENERISFFSQKDGLPSNMIFAIQQDMNGILWISTGNGLSRFDPQNLNFKNFYVYDGLQDNEFRNGATIKDKDGKMYFGGINGITAFYPNKVDNWKQPMSNIYFSQLTVLNRSVNYVESLGKSNILDRHISQARQITLKNNQNVFSLEFAVLEYTNPQKVVYGYMLRGFDPDWRYTDANHRSATYTNLPDGRYTFRVKAFFEGNSIEEDVVYNQINIHILPPWYKTWWAYLIYLTVFMAIVWQFLNFLTRRRLRIQERMEFERKEMKLRMFTDLSHEIRTPLTLVINPLKSMRETETDHKRKDMYNLMYRNSLRILRLINQLMDMRKIDNHQLQMHFNQTDLIFFIQDIMKSFEQVAIMRNIDFRLVANRESLDVWIDQGNFDKVLFNILSNAFKFTPDNGYMLISVDTFENNKHSGLPANVPEYVEIHFENSGSFIDESDLERIFDRFYQMSGSNKGGSGIGLHLAKMIVHLHHGTITAKNVEKGVAFIIRIPLGNTHLSTEELSAAAKHKDLYSSIRSDEKLPSQAEYIEMPETEDEDSVSKISKSKKTLVFVDDDTDLGKYIRLELSDKYNVEIFSDGKEAWKAISTTIPDAVITDLIMPEVDGISLCQKIRQKPETNYLPVIILTSETDEETERRCIENGADSFLTKPISLELLKITVAQAIQTRDMIRNKYRSNVKLDLNEIQMNSPDSRLIANVIETIRKNIENPEFSVDDLSHEVGLSRVHLNRKLKENINISPNNLIKSIRLKQAAYLLIKNKVNVSEVAYKVGFSSPSYFSNNFREYFGMAPSEFVVKYADSDDKEILNKLFEG